MSREQKVIQHIPIAQIKREGGLRDRSSGKSPKGIARSIQEAGLFHPVLLDRSHTLIAGGRRLDAMMLLGWETVPAIVEDRELSKAERIQRQWVENGQRLDLTPSESAKAIEGFIQASGLAANEAAGKLGLSSSSLSRDRALLGLPDWILALVDDGQIAKSAAYHLTGIRDVEEQAAFVRRLTEGLTRDELVQELKSGKRPGKKSSRRVKSVTAPVGSGISLTVKGKGLNLELFIEAIKTVLSKAQKVQTSGGELGTFVRVLREDAKGKSTSPAAVGAAM